MKKYLSILLSLLILFSVGACWGDRSVGRTGSEFPIDDKPVPSKPAPTAEESPPIVEMPVEEGNPWLEGKEMSTADFQTEFDDTGDWINQYISSVNASATAKSIDPKNHQTFINMSHSLLRSQVRFNEAMLSLSTDRALELIAGVKLIVENKAANIEQASEPEQKEWLTAVLVGNQVIYALVKTLEPFCGDREITRWDDEKETLNLLDEAIRYREGALDFFGSDYLKEHSEFLSVLSDLQSRGLVYSDIYRENFKPSNKELRAKFKDLRKSANGRRRPLSDLGAESKNLKSLTGTIGSSQAGEAEIFHRLQYLSVQEDKYVRDLFDKVKEFTTENSNLVEVSSLNTQITELDELFGETRNLMINHTRILSLSDEWFEGDWDNVIDYLNKNKEFWFRSVLDSEDDKMLELFRDLSGYGMRSSQIERILGDCGVVTPDVGV